jgi:hypothetical protein
MKRSFILVTVVLLMGGAGLAAGLKLDKPNGGEYWAPGSVQTVQWTANGISQAVKLVLFRNGARVGRIKGGLNATGSFAWTVGAFDGGSAASGGGYKIQVQTTDGAYADESDAPFTIGTASGAGGSAISTHKPDLSNVQLAKPDLSKLSTGPGPAARITRIERLDPDRVGLRTENADFMQSVKASGQALDIRGAPNTPEYDRTFLVARDVDNGASFHLAVDEWTSGQIVFHADSDMRPGYYDVFIEKNYSPASNKVRLKVSPNQPCIQAITPTSVPSGAPQCHLVISGLDFDLAAAPRAVVIMDQNFNRTPLAVTFWSDRAIQARIAPLPAPGSYYILVEFPAATPNGKGYSNPALIEIH